MILAIIAIVGENMKHNPGTSGRMFGTLGKNGVNVQAIAQGSSELNISAVIRQSDVAKHSMHCTRRSFYPIRKY
jgi:Aspartokinases